MSSENIQVAFLRGINVGGHRVEGHELVAILESVGLSDVFTFLASGNVVFSAGSSSGAAPSKELLRGDIESALGEALGYEVPVILRSADELRDLAADQPFGEDEIAASKGKPQVILLLDEPSREAASQVAAMGNVNDSLIIEGCTVHWLPSNGVLKSDLDVSVVERLIGPTTMRTKNTIERIVKKYL